MNDEAIDACTAPFLASDLAAEVRNVYFDQTTVGVSAGQATAAVFESFRHLLADPNEGPVVLLALAALQLRDGQLLDAIREAALECIESGDAAKAWRPTDSMMNTKRKEALATFSALLMK